MNLLVLILIAAASAQPKLTDSPVCKVCACDDATGSVRCTGERVPPTLLNTTTNWVRDNQSYPVQQVSVHDTAMSTVYPMAGAPITSLDLSHNRIQFIRPSSFRELANLTELVLSVNQLTSLALSSSIFEGHYRSGSYFPLEKLRVLRMDGNVLHTLPSSLFEHVAGIEVLDLHANPFKVIDKNTEIALTNLPFLKELNLRATELTELPVYLLHTPSALKMLDLSENHLTEVPECLKYSRALEWLSLNENPIANVTAEKGFSVMERLQVLHMCNMPELKRISDHSLSGLINLKELYLSNNPKLGHISPNAMSRIEKGSESETWPKLNTVILNNNKLTRLEIHFFGRLDGINDIDISDNPWTCECENQWMVDTLMKYLADLHNKNDTRWRNIMCAAPIEMEGISLFHLYVHNITMRCLDLYGGRPERDASVLVGMLIGLLTCIPLVLTILYCHNKKWFGFFNSGPASFSRQFYKRASPGDEDF